MTTFIPRLAHVSLPRARRALERVRARAAGDTSAARAVVFPLQDPDRRPAYRVPNDRVLEWGRESGGRLTAYCRLDPDDDPVAEAERCLARGARGIKLHQRGRDWESVHPAVPAIFEVAREADVPILLHAGRNLRSMGVLVEVALQFPEVALVFAHAGIADQAVLTTGLAHHPRVLYDTSCFVPYDVVELFAQVPAESIVFGSDAPYGQPVEGLSLAMRAAAYAGLGAGDRALVAGGTMTAVLDGDEPPGRNPTAAGSGPSSCRLAGPRRHLPDDGFQRGALSTTAATLPRVVMDRACPRRLPGPSPWWRRPGAGADRQPARHGRAADHHA